VEVSKQDVGFDIEELELASRIALSEASDQHHVDCADSSEEASSSSDTEPSSDDDDDSSCSSSSDSSVTGLDCAGTKSRSDDGLSDVGPSSLIGESSSAADAAVEPTELVCQQLSSLTVSDKPTPAVSALPQSNSDIPVQQ